jgi:DNA-binding NarL/FixJ family response regulator
MSVTSVTRTLVVDDHTIVRECIRALLQRQSGITVVGLAATGEQSIVAAERLKPDLIVMDLGLPGLNGTEATQLILRALPTARVIVLSTSDVPEHVRGAFRAGAHGYVVKEALGSDLVSAVAAVMIGKRYLSSQIADCLGDSDLNSGLSSLWQDLTPREREVLRRTAAGVSTAQIAQQLSLSPKTVDSYRSRLMRKLGLPNRSTLIRYTMLHSASPNYP